MSSKHILGIGQLEPGKVVIIHGNSLQCDHMRPLATLEECEECLKAAKMPVDASKDAEHVSEPNHAHIATSR